jgi:hypothetical protein
MRVPYAHTPTGAFPTPPVHSFSSHVPAYSHSPSPQQYVHHGNFIPVGSAYISPSAPNYAQPHPPHSFSHPHYYHNNPSVPQPFAPVHDLKLQSRNIPLLGLDNHHVWKRRVTDALGLKGVQRFLTVPPNEHEVLYDQQVYFFLRTLISESLIEVVGEHHCTASLWHAVSSLYVASAQTTLQQLKRDLYQSKLGKQTVTEYLESVMSLARQISDLSAPIPAREIVCTIIDGLPETYSALKTIIRYELDNLNWTIICLFQTT